MVPILYHYVRFYVQYLHHVCVIWTARA